MTAELHDTPAPAIAADARFAQLVHKLECAYARYEIDEGFERVKKTLSFANEEWDWRAEQMKKHDRPGSRWLVSPTQSDAATRQMFALVELRLYSELMIAKSCNELLGDDSPYLDDPMLKLHPEQATIENYLDALHRVQRAERRGERAPSEAKPRKSETRAEPTPRKTDSQASVSKPELKLLKGGKESTPVLVEAPTTEVMDAYREWIADYNAWVAAGDPEVIMPEYPAHVLEDITRRAPYEPDFAKAKQAAEEFIRARDAQIKQLNNPGKGGRNPATS